MANNPRLVDIPAEPETVLIEAPAEADRAAERLATVWVSRVTSVVGLICLALALVEWALRPNHYRLVLALLTVAMFAAILHSYTFENGG